jgi:hypothetical protein
LRRLLCASVVVLLLAACSHDDLGPYVREADEVLTDINHTSDSLSAEFAALPELGSASFFSSAQGAFSRGRDAVSASADRWGSIKAPSGQKAFHARLARYIDDAQRFYAGLADAAGSKSYERFFSAYSGAAELIDEGIALNQAWVDLAKKAKFDTSAVEGRLKESSAEKTALRNYVVKVLPLLGRLEDAFQELAQPASVAATGDYFANVNAFASRGGQAIRDARRDFAALTVPASAAAAHAALLKMVDSLQDLYDRLLLGARARQFRTLAEAYSSIGSILRSAQAGDCEWRNLVARADLSATAQKTCSATQPRGTAELEYAVGAFAVWGDLTDSIVASGPTFSALSNQSAAEAFASLRTLAATLRSNCARELAAARALAPPASSRSFQDELISYLTDLSAIVDEISSAAAANDSARYNALRPRLGDLFGPRYKTLSDDLTAILTPAFRGLTGR